VVLRAKLAAAGIDDVTVSSSATGDWHTGQPMDPRAAAALARHGYDGSRHRARTFRTEWLGERDLVLVMDSGHLAALVHRGGPDAAEAVALFAAEDVPDPYYGDDADFDAVVVQAEKAADVLVERLSRPGRSGPAAR
jgi:protein-tyrosine phosphatase